MFGADLTGRAIARAGARRLAVAGLLTAAFGMAVPALSMYPATVALGMAIAGAGTGAIFVVASATPSARWPPTNPASPPASSAPGSHGRGEPAAY
jgi:MFS family permease